MNRLTSLCSLFLLALYWSDAVPHSEHHHQHRHHNNNNHSLEHGLFTKHIAPITKSSPPSPNRHRAMYQWNDTSNSFHQTYFKLPADAPFLKNEQFFTTYKHVSSINETVDHTQCQWPILMEIFAGKTNGFFIDLASNHWKDGSNTVGLEEFFNWKGICVEPTARYWEGILSNRKCTLVASPVYYENNVQVTFHAHDGLGGIVAAGMDNEKAKGNNVILPTVTLNSILDTFAPASLIRKAPPLLGGGRTTTSPIPTTHRRVIDYFSLDIESAEYDAMKNFDFDHTVFLVITIERPNELLHALLVKQGYWFLRNVWRDGEAPFGEAVYLHYTCPRFVELMTKHRQHPKVQYNHNYLDHNPLYLLRPAWSPMEALVRNLSTTTTTTTTTTNTTTTTTTTTTANANANATMGRGDPIRHQQSSMYKLFETFRSTFTTLMVDGDLFKCHRKARQVYYFRGGRAYPIPSMAVFVRLDQGRRDMGEVFVVSPSYCEQLPMGNALDATTAALPPNDPFWFPAPAAAAASTAGATAAAAAAAA